MERASMRDSAHTTGCFSEKHVYIFNVFALVQLVDLSSDLEPLPLSPHQAPDNQLEAVGEV